jgi:Spy/CpxP family protein refolding chaperone
MARWAGLSGLAVTAAFLVSAALSAAGTPSPRGPRHELAAQAASQGGGSGRSPAGSPPAGGTFGPSWDWWADPAVKKDLKLSDEQASRIRDIFEKREAEVKPVWDQLTREGDRLDKMTRERVADEATYAVQVGKVHHLFAEVRKSRTVMMYRMYRELQPEQYRKLQDIMERRRAMDGRGSGPR